MANQLASGFLSYARSDDENEEGRITRLARKIMAEFQTLTGASIEIFIDRSSLKWGDAFRPRLDQALQETTFFIPILTPTYFLRDECRKEMLNFVRSAKALGLEELLMSIRYVPIADLTEDSSDELKAAAAAMHYEDWTQLRLVDENSALYRTGINGLAQRLVDLTHTLEKRPSAEEVATVGIGLRTTRAATKAEFPHQADEPSVEGEEDLGEPGLIDLLADLEPAMDKWLSTMTSFSTAVDPFNEAFTRATTDMNAANAKPNAIAFKIIRARQLAEEVEMPLQRIEVLSKDYSSDLMRCDQPVRAFISTIEIASADHGNTENSAAALAIETIRGIVKSSREAMASVSTAAETARAVSGTSRDLRPILRRYEAAMRNVADAQYIIDSWDQEIDRLSFTS